ncbi:MAG: hypothetical protein WBD58_20475 [Geitlerinemataceae cyanobacterium]
MTYARQSPSGESRTSYELQLERSPAEMRGRTDTWVRLINDTECHAAPEQYF